MAFTRANIPQLVLGSMLPISSGFGSLPDTRILQAAVVLMFGIRGTGLPFSTAKIPFGSLENTNAVLLTILVDSQGSIQSSLIHSDSSPPSSRQHTLGHLAKWRLHVHPGERVSPYLYSFTDMPLLIQLDWPSYHADNCPRTWNTEGSEIKRWGDEYRTHGFHQSVFFLYNTCAKIYWSTSCHLSKWKFPSHSSWHVEDCNKSSSNKKILITQRPRGPVIGPLTSVDTPIVPKVPDFKWSSHRAQENKEKW